LKTLRAHRPDSIHVLIGALVLVGAMMLAACGGDDDSSKRETALEQALVLDKQTKQAVSNPRFIRAQAQGQPTNGGGQPTNGGDDFPYTPDQVIELFRGANVPLVVSEEYTGGDTILDVDEAQTDEVFSKYGPFRLFVVTSQQSLDATLTDAGGNRVEPDAEGIHWVLWEGEYEGEPYKFWAATKPFKNVVAWWIDGEDKQTNEGWNQLTALLEQLPQ
jgi:hypothetical protein